MLKWGKGNVLEARPVISGKRQNREVFSAKCASHLEIFRHVSLEWIATCAVDEKRSEKKNHDARTFFFFICG